MKRESKLNINWFIIKRFVRNKKDSIIPENSYNIGNSASRTPGWSHAILNENNRRKTYVDEFL